MDRSFIVIESSAADRAWARYQKLVLAANEDKSLWADLDHCRAIFTAHEEFRKAFLELEAA